MVLVIIILLSLLVFSGVFVIHQGMIPGFTLPQVGTFNLQDMLKTGGVGLFLILIGSLTLNSGLRAVRERRTRVDLVDEDSSEIREVSGCRAVIHGIWRLGFGFLILLSGLVLTSLALFQQILPGLGW